MSTLLEHLAARKLLVVTGKGGVGKSSVTACLGRALADHGKRVLLLDVDPRESLYQLLDVAPSGGEVVEVAPRLHLQNLRPRAVIDQLVREHLRVEFLVRRVLDSPVYEHFVEGAPGLTEMAVLGHAYRVSRGEAGRAFPRVDVILLDAPASGHGLSLLEAPRLVADVIESGPIGKLSRRLAEFLEQPDAFGSVLTAFAEEMPIQETLETIQAMRQRLDREPDLVTVNRLYPPLDGSGDDDGEDHAQDPLVARWRERRAVNERELRRLATVWTGPEIHLPLLPVMRGPELVAGLLPVLTSRLAEEAPR